MRKKKGFVPRTYAKPREENILIMEDNEPVIKMTIKGRSPNLRHLLRTHRVHLVFIFDCFRNNLGVPIRLVGTNKQMADALTDGQFTALQRSVLCDRSQLGYKTDSLANPSLRGERLDAGKGKRETVTRK